MRGAVATKRPYSRQDSRVPAGRRGSGGKRSRRGIVALVTITLALCVALVGVASVITTSMILRPASQPARAATPIAPAQTLQSSVPAPSPVCYLPPYVPRMLTPQEIAHPLVTGRLTLPNGATRPCVRSALLVPRPTAGVPTISGHVILVSLSQQWLWAYQNGKLVFATPVTTGMPYLWTPQGIFTITDKVTNTTFYSPWPPGSPFYYTPEHVNYAMLFRHGGYFIHDAPWRHKYGPGSNLVPGQPGEETTGTHGCVNVPLDVQTKLFAWTDLGTPVVIQQ